MREKVRELVAERTPGTEPNERAVWARTVARVLPAKSSFATGRAAAWRPILATFALLIVLAAATVVAGCASQAPSEQSTSTTLSALMQAYYQEHPSPLTVPMHPTGASTDQIISAIRKNHATGGQIFLPDYLPAGFSLAAPYYGDGSGNAFPNPNVWAAGYSVTYTDGTAYVVVVVNSDDDLNDGDWAALKETALGRPLKVQEEPTMVRVATVVEAGKPSVFVAGGGFAKNDTRQELIKIAVSLSVR